MAQRFGRAEEHFSLTIRGDDGSTMLETRVGELLRRFPQRVGEPLQWCTFFLRFPETGCPHRWRLRVLGSLPRHREPPHD